MKYEFKQYLYLNMSEKNTNLYQITPISTPANTNNHICAQWIDFFSFFTFFMFGFTRL